MSYLKKIFDFSSNGEYLAYSSPDGCLKIWETSTNILKQEYTPSSHLSATCSSLRWGPCKPSAHPRKKVKKSKDESIQTAVTDLQLIAIGTLTGGILLYSFTNAEVHSFLEKGHMGSINDISWHTEDDSLFSCSNDLHIAIWSISKGKIKTTWKADNNPIHSICVIDSNNMLSCSNSILWWNIKKKTVIKTFFGHTTEVFRLLTVNSANSGSYFLSAAVDDRIINAWHLNEDNEDNRSVASFVLSDEPQCLNVISRKNKPFIMHAVAKDGSLHIFQHSLNGKIKKPLHPKITVRIASKVEGSSKPHTIPIVAADMNEDLDSCILVYGSFLMPFFEKIDLSESSQNVFLVRDTSLAASSRVEDNVLKIKQADKSAKVKILAPGHMMTDKTSHSASRKRKKKRIDIQELPVEERLKALDLSRSPASREGSKMSVTSNSMLHLLLQGLQSKDNNMLSTVLQCGDESIIHNTVKNLPLQSIFLLLRELHERLNKREPGHHPCLRWMKGLLTLHLPYLMSCKDIDEYLSPISQLIDARVQNFSKMCQLRGCLKILLSQVSSTDLTTDDKTSQPLLTYQSESSEESENEEMDPNENVSDNEVLENSATDKSESSDSEDSMNI